jgi:hypothetical protein
VGDKPGRLWNEILAEKLTLLTPMTLLPACAAFATVCEDMVSFACAARAQLTWWGFRGTREMEVRYGLSSLWFGSGCRFAEV